MKESKPLDPHLASMRDKIKPNINFGVPGTAIYGGYIQHNEKSSLLVSREERYRTYSEMLANSSIVSTGVRLFLSIISKTKWTFVPSEFDIDNEFSSLAESALTVTPATPWHRIVRRAAMYRFYGFSIQEWTAKHQDGIITFADIAPRAQITIDRWDVNTDGTVCGLVQMSPQDNRQIYIPRTKCLYMVDDSLNDSPEGLGLFRHLIAPSKRLKRYEQLEGVGFETDLRGIPIGRGPFMEMHALVTSGTITNAQRLELEAPLRAFIDNHIRSERLGILLDSGTYKNQDESQNPSPQKQWDIDILKGSSTSFAENAAAIERINREMARILGVEHLLLGSSSTGSFALSKDKTSTFLAIVDSVLTEISESIESDLLKVLWSLNGWPVEMMPTVTNDTAAHLSVEQITAALRDLAASGVMLDETDPIINDIRAMMGVSLMPDRTLDNDMDASLQDLK